MKRPHFLVIWVASIVLLIAACATPQEGEASGSRPRLVVLLVIDGLPQRQLTDYRDQYGPDGLRRLLERGAWFENAHHGHAVTVTAPGHAVLLTGAHPHRTGIIDNEWYDAASRAWQGSAADPAHAYIGHKTGRLDGTSPKNLRVESLGDVLKAARPASKVIAIAGKDRAAILPAGKAGTAYMYQAATGRFASSSYYMKEHPAWVEQFNAARPADAFFRREWQPVLADPAAYKGSVPDGQEWFSPGGKLPKRAGDGLAAPAPRFYAELLAFPFGDELTLAFARAAIAGEALGRDDAPDIVVVSLSTHDYVNHAYGAESRISHDHVLHLDRLLQAFFRDLDAAVGSDAYVAVLTSDHGFTPAPEYSLTLGRAAGRDNGRQMVARLNAGLALTFGDGDWILALSAYGLVYNRALVAERKVDPAVFEAEVRRLVLQQPAVSHVFTRAEILEGKPTGRFFEQVRRSWDAERSADLQVVLKPYWVFSRRTGTTHGTPYAYDSHVPLVFYGPAWVPPGRRDRPVEIADLAPTLARILGIRAPAASEGRALDLKAP